MHAKTEIRTFPKPPQHQVMQNVQKLGQAAQKTPNKGVKSNYNTTNSLPVHSITLPKNQSVPYNRKVLAVGAKNQVNNQMNKNKYNNQMIYKRCDHFIKNVSNWVRNNKNMKTQNPIQRITPMYKNIVNKNINIPKNIVPKAVRPAENIYNSVVQPKVLPQKVVPLPINKTPNTPPPSANNINKNKIIIVKQKNEEIKELYKTAELKDSTENFASAKSHFSAPPSRNDFNQQSEQGDNLNFQQVTQNLAHIIKNFQKQIQEVPLTTAAMEQVPSAMIQPKVKEFFKKITQETPLIQKTPVDTKPEQDEPQQNANTKTPPNSGSKNQVQSKTGSSSSGLTKKGSLGRFSASSDPGTVRRFHSMTHHSLTSNSSGKSVVNRASSLSIDPLKQLKEEVRRAMRDRKTFTVRGQFQPIRKALLGRGWVEKFHISYKDQLNDEMKRYQNYTITELLPLMRKEDLTNMCKSLIKSKLLGGYQVDFYWGFSDEAFKENPDKIKLTIINKLKREIFSYTNKQGLCDASKFSYWYQKPNVSKLNHPRSYSLGKNGDVKGFMEDFYITAAMSLLKWVVKINATKECKLLSVCGKIPLETFDFALNECCKFIKKMRHEDIDVNIPDATEYEWHQFLDYFYKLVHYSNHFHDEKTETEDSLVRKSNYILNNLKGFYPYVDMDGMMNIWILKPTASSRGRGIHMCRTLAYVLKVIKQNFNTRYIIQKYIERPLLIFNTKFDIRQWFLISNCCPLTIWMYKECYLRFSSQTYNLRKLHESIHLTNNSVQCKYKNNSMDAALPSYNMWDSAEFERYLSNIGYPKAFKELIYPGMRQSITAAVLMHQDKMVIRKNCFELYGADFILTEDFQPWLLEINSNPALSASTPVTARMCPRVLEDVIKVVIDHPLNNKASTGGFEMIYREQLSRLPLPANATLEIRGTPLQSSYFFHESHCEPEPEPEPLTVPVPYKNTTAAVDKAQDCLQTFSEEIKKTLKNLLQIIHNEKIKRGLQGSRTGNLKI